MRKHVEEYDRFHSFNCYESSLPRCLVNALSWDRANHRLGPLTKELKMNGKWYFYILIGLLCPGLVSWWAVEFFAKLALDAQIAYVFGR